MKNIEFIVGVHVKKALLGCVVDAFGILIDHVKCILSTSYKTKM